MTMSNAEVHARLFPHAWPSPKELVEFANACHGYCGDDGCYGVTYPSDLDGYAREVEGEFIPQGFVEILYWDGAHKELWIPEQEYLSALRQHLSSKGLGELASELREDGL